MITIKEIEDENSAEIHIPEGTKVQTVLLGTEMLIESLVEISGRDIDSILNDLRRIYIRDNGE